MPPRNPNEKDIGKQSKLYMHRSESGAVST